MCGGCLGLGACRGPSIEEAAGILVFFFGMAGLRGPLRPVERLDVRGLVVPVEDPPNGGCRYTRGFWGLVVPVEDPPRGGCRYTSHRKLLMTGLWGLVMTLCEGGSRHPGLLPREYLYS